MARGRTVVGFVLLVSIVLAIPILLYTRQGNYTHEDAVPRENGFLRREKYYFSNRIAEEVAHGAESTRRALFDLAFVRRRAPRRHPRVCWSKAERRLYQTAFQGQASPAYVQRIKEYSEMHARCTNIGDWTAFYMNHSAGHRAGADLSGCKYILWMSPLYAGLGNRLQSLVSVFAYALLTDRAILMGPAFPTTKLLCQPFEKSSWLVSQSGFRTIYYNILKWQPKVANFSQRIRNDMNWDKRAVYVDLRFKAAEEEWAFFCPQHQQHISEAKFMGFQTDEYTIPGFYLIPEFASKLDAWFPDSLSFLHLSRFILHPSNYLWQRITRKYTAYLARHSKRLGIQVRTFYRNDEATDSRVLECATNISGYLPTAISSEKWVYRLRHRDSRSAALLRNPHPRSASVFLTSLSSHHLEHLVRYYSDSEPEDGTVVALHSEGHDGEERRGELKQYEKAIVEMWLLSFSDQLLVSDGSSFGYIPAAMSGILPFTMNVGFRTNFLNWYKNGRPVCAQAATSEPCFIASPKSLQCGADKPAVDPVDLSPRLQRCSHIGFGLEVVRENLDKDSYR